MFALSPHATVAFVKDAEQMILFSLGVLVVLLSIPAIMIYKARHRNP